MFRIEADLVYRFPEAAEVLLLMEAATSRDQHVNLSELEISSSRDIARLDDPISGERRAVFSAEGEMVITYRANVEVLSRDVALLGAQQSLVRDLPADALRYLRGSRYCQADRFEGFCRDTFRGSQGGDRVQAILDWIAKSLSYESGVSDASTTAIDTFVDRAGVCRDFTHLAVALCRASDIPARAVSAYAFRLEPPDMHAVAEVYVGGAWRLIDPTGKCPLDGLVRVATGLDAADIAFMTVFGKAELVSQSFAVSEIGGP